LYTDSLTVSGIREEAVVFPESGYVGPGISLRFIPGVEIRWALRDNSRVRILDAGFILQDARFRFKCTAQAMTGNVERFEDAAEVATGSRQVEIPAMGTNEPGSTKTTF